MELKIASCTVTKEILNAEDTSQTVHLFRIPSDCIPLFIGGRVRTAIAGVTKPKVAVGITGDTARYVPSQRIDRAGDLITGTAGVHKQICMMQGVDYVSTETNRSVLGTFSSSSGNFSSVSAGEILFYCVYLEP